MNNRSLIRYGIAALLLICCSRNTVAAQYIFSGKVEYERRVNVHAQYEGDSWFEKFKSDVAKFSNTYFNLYFDTGRIMYRPGKEVDNPNRWGNGPASENIVFTNLTTHRVTALKSIYETKFLLMDSARELTWKERPEIRTIAGHPCHKAVAVICDSVYVVAFYAEDIPVAGGPEMFGGLPGLILELAVPRLHTTWTAQSIQQLAPSSEDMKMPEKGKKVSGKQLMESISESFKDWGKNANRYVWWTVL